MFSHRMYLQQIGIFSILEYKRKIEVIAEQSLLDSQSKNYEELVENKDKEKENIANDLRKSKNKVAEMSKELMNKKLQFKELENEY